MDRVEIDRFELEYLKAQALMYKTTIECLEENLAHKSSGQRSWNITLGEKSVICKVIDDVMRDYKNRNPVLKPKEGRTYYEVVKEQYDE